MSILQSLYFIALLPDRELAERITNIKNSFARNYNCVAALKTMPHITLKSPFKRGPEVEVEMHMRLQHFFEQHNGFTVQLSGFGCFDNPKNKVIYINVLKNEQLSQLHKNLMSYLQSELYFREPETPFAFHPHITLGYRDLSPENFSQAWKVYEHAEFTGKFKVSAAFLLKHNYRNWEVLSMFQLKTV